MSVYAHINHHNITKLVVKPVLGIQLFFASIPGFVRIGDNIGSVFREFRLLFWVERVIVLLFFSILVIVIDLQIIWWFRGFIFLLLLLLFGRCVTLLLNRFFFRILFLFLRIRTVTFLFGPYQLDLILSP